MRIHFILYLFLFVCQIELCQAQENQFRLTKVPAPKALQTWGFMNVTCIAENAQGYMWFGTGGSGLMRYDGSNVVYYTRDYGNSDSLASNEISFIYPDSSGKLLIGTRGQGLDIYDPATGIFKHFRHAVNDANSLRNDTVTAIMKDREGFIWIGTYGGLNKFDEKTERFTHYFHNDKDSTSLSNDQVRVIYEDKHGVIWIGTGSPFLNEGGTKEKGGLNRLDIKSGKFIRFLHNPNDPSSLIDNRVGAIFEDQRGIFWIGTAGQGLHTMNREAGTFERHLFDPAHPEKLSRFLPHETRFAADHITFIVDDSTSNIWIGTFAGPLIQYNFAKNKISTFNLSNSKFDSLTGFEAQSRWKASTSSDRIFWISGFGWENLYKVEPLTKPITTVAVNEQINSLFAVNDSMVWIGTQNGLILHDRKRGIIERINRDSIAGAGLSSNLISCIGSGRANKLWVGTFGGGVDIIDQKNNAIISYRHNPKNNQSLSNDTVSAVYEDQANNLWVGTTKGLDRMDIATGKFSHYQNDAHDSNGLFIISPTIIYQDEKSLWIGGWGDVGFVGYAGLYQLNLETGKFRHYLHLHRVFSVFADSDKVIWVGTDKGLFQFNKQSGVFSPFLDPGGTEINWVSSIVEDKDKNLWVTLTFDIIKINPNRDQVSSFGEYFGMDRAKRFPFGLNSPSFGFNALKNESGELLFSSDSGYFAMLPSSLTYNLKPPSVQLTQFNLGNKIVKPGDGGPLKFNIGSTDEIKLHYNQNLFSFNFQAIDYFEPAKDRFIYMLENYDNAWRKAGPEQMAYYFNIPPGNYVFKVRAINSKQIWGEKKLILVITPPWWRTWWAYLLYAVSIIGILWAIIHNRSQQLVKEKQELEKKVQLRTMEVIKQKEEISIQRDSLEGALTELKSTQAQLIQREKMASLGELTAGIAHEIQNPLNFVKNFSEINSELAVELDQEIEKGNFEQVKALARDIKSNEDKIKHHGNRADGIVKGMLQHSRKSTGQTELTDINALTDEFLRLSFHGFRAKDKAFNATLNTDFDLNNEKINIIPQDIGRVLLNLYNNSFYAVTEKKKLQGEGYVPTVTVSTKKMDGKVEIRVSDNGGGIPQNLRDKIFQPFFTTKPSGQGTGLGLSLSHDIIKAHGGEIKVETKEGDGTEFIIQLPV